MLVLVEADSSLLAFMGSYEFWLTGLSLNTLFPTFYCTKYVYLHLYPSLNPHIILYSKKVFAIYILPTSLIVLRLSWALKIRTGMQ